MYGLGKKYGDHPVQVKQIMPNQTVVLEWQSHGNNTTQAVLSFETTEDTKTTLKINESGWEENQKGLDSSYDNCSGWTHMGLCLKAYLEHGIDLRT